MTERWKPVVGFESYYEVSSNGRVRRLVSATNTHCGKLLALTPNKRGYVRISLTANGKRKDVGVHQIVAEAFLGPCPVDKEVNHKNGTKHDNHYDNLEYLTQLENKQHAARTGLTPRGDRSWQRRKPELLARGSRVATSKLNEGEVQQILWWSGRGVSDCEIARRLNHKISRRGICRITSREHWKHVTAPDVETVEFEVEL